MRYPKEWQEASKRDFPRTVVRINDKRADGPTEVIPALIEGEAVSEAAFYEQLHAFNTACFVTAHHFIQKGGTFDHIALFS